MPKIFQCDDGTKIAYQQLEGKSPGVVFLGGFKSDMSGTKATYLESFCKEIGQAFIRFDYFGHGQSDGAIEEGTLTRWKKDVLTVLDHVAEGPQILVGSSMGGWLMVLAALERPAQVKGLVGIAAAPDFTSDLTTLSIEHQKALETESAQAFIKESRSHYILNKEININCKVHLLHGMKDEDVSWHKAISLAAALSTNDVTITLIKEGDHRLSREQDLQRLGQIIRELI